MQEIGRQLAPQYTAIRVTAREIIHVNIHDRKTVLIAVCNGFVFNSSVEISNFSSTQLTSLDTSLDYFMLADSSDQTTNDNSHLAFLENGCQIPVANRDLWK